MGSRAASNPAEIAGFRTLSHPPSPLSNPRTTRVRKAVRRRPPAGDRGARARRRRPRRGRWRSRRCQRAARDQEPVADLDDLDELGWVAVEVTMLLGLGYLMAVVAYRCLHPASDRNDARLEHQRLATATLASALATRRCRRRVASVTNVAGGSSIRPSLRAASAASGVNHAWSWISPPSTDAPLVGDGEVEPGSRTVAADPRGSSSAKTPRASQARYRSPLPRALRALQRGAPPDRRHHHDGPRHQRDRRERPKRRREK